MASTIVIALILGSVAIAGTIVGFFSDRGNSAIAEAELSVVEFLPQLKGPHELVQAQVSFPVLLPIEIPGINNFWVTPRTLGAPDAYRFTIDLDRDCDGTGACTAGSFGGELITDESTAALQQQYTDLEELPPDWPRSDESAGPVELAQDIEGEFIPWQGSAQCTEARVYWLEGQYRYYVGLECGAQERMIEFANSVINNTSR